MLRFLSVRHLAVIDRLEVEFGPGLNVLTGETGAGKSMVVSALDLLTGGRASPDLIRSGEDHASVQAIFERADGREVIVRREISTQGRSRAFIDDVLATTTALRDLGASLVSLHGQHEHQALLDPAEHGPALDVFAGLAADAQDVERRFRAWREAAGALERVQLDDRHKAARIDLAAFQLTEIDKLAPVAGEDAALADERTVLSNVDRLSRLCGEASLLLYDGEDAVLAKLGIVWRRLGELEALDGRFRPYVHQRDDVKTPLEDLAFFLRSYAGRLEASPQRLQAVEDRLAGLDRLKKKHGPGLEDVLRKQSELRTELADLESTAERAQDLEARLNAAAADYLGAARSLSSARGEAAGRLGRQLEDALAALAMPKARLEVRVQPDDLPGAWSASGIDTVEFFLSANPGENVRPLSRIASGGELSRVMLALRTLSGSRAGETLIFDEVDAGIGGTAADAVGARLQDLATTTQVLCITHLPQIAARADLHFEISKGVEGERTVTAVKQLDRAGRELEVGRMIAGAEVSDQVRSSARELIASRRRSEQKANGESEGRMMAKAKGARGGT